MTISIPEMAWPNPEYGIETEEEFSLERRFRYKMTDEEMNYIASVLAAYRALFTKTQKQRDFIFREIKKELREYQC